MNWKLSWGINLSAHTGHILVAADKIETVDLKQNKLWAGGHECMLSRAGKAMLRKTLGGSQ